MCNRTDCYGSAFGPMACAVCWEVDMGETTLTDAELTRLEALIKHKNVGGSTALHYLPSLVAEVRRLRAELEQVQHGMTAAYMAGSVDARKEAEAEVHRLREALNKEHRAWQCAEMRGDALEEENAALRDMVEALGKCEIAASCCAICNNSPADKITLHESDAPWEIYAPYEVCLCREHQLALIGPVQEAIKAMKEERNAQVSA